MLQTDGVAPGWYHTPDRAVVLPGEPFEGNTLPGRSYGEPSPTMLNPYPRPPKMRPPPRNGRRSEWPGADFFPQPSDKPCLPQAIVQFRVLCPIDPVPYEPVFVFRQIGERAANGLDLAVEFSTLGEYGFLPAEDVAPERGSTAPCAPAPRSVPARPRARRPGFRERKDSCRGPAEGPRSEASVRRGAVQRPADPIPRVGVIGALRTPRIELDSAA